MGHPGDGAPGGWGGDGAPGGWGTRGMGHPFVIDCCPSSGGLQEREAEECDWYFAGTECKDLSYANTTSQKNITLTATAQEDLGRSSRTLQSSMNYIDRFQPKIVILEQVYRLQVVPLVLQRMRQFGIYDCEAFVVDNRDFGLPHSRRRLAIVGVNLRKAHLRKPIHAWQSALQRMSVSIPKSKISDFLLPDDHDDIIGLRNELQDKMDNRDVAAERETFVQSKGFKKHEEIRKTLRVLYNVDVPTWDEMITTTPGWGSLLSLREQDVLNLHWWVCVNILHINPSEHAFWWDLTNSITYPLEKPLQGRSRPMPYTESKLLCDKQGQVGIWPGAHEAHGVAC